MKIAFLLKRLLYSSKDIRQEQKQGSPWQNSVEKTFQDDKLSEQDRIQRSIPDMNLESPKTPNQRQSFKRLIF